MCLAGCVLQKIWLYVLWSVDCIFDTWNTHYDFMQSVFLWSRFFLIGLQFFGRVWFYFRDCQSSPITVFGGTSTSRDWEQPDGRKTVAGCTAQPMTSLCAPVITWRTSLLWRYVMTNRCRAVHDISRQARSRQLTSTCTLGVGKKFFQEGRGRAACTVWYLICYITHQCLHVTLSFRSSVLIAVMAVFSIMQLEICVIY